MALLIDHSSFSYNLTYYGSGARQLQTFTMPSGYDTVEYIDLYLKETGTLPGNYTLEVYATSGGLPTGSVLATASVDSGDVGSSNSWIRFNFSDITVTPGAKYAIVVKQTSTTSTSNAVGWGYSSSNTYSGGNSYYSVNSGSSWNSQTGDMTFRVYGTQSASAPTVTTGSVTNLATTSADVGGNVTNDGGATITQRGIVYSTSDSTPDTGDLKKTVVGTTGAFTGSLTGLLPGTLYYARAYAINSQGTSYGSVVEFETDTTAATVTTGSISTVTSSSASVGGSVTSDGGAAVTERGIAYDTASTPEITDNKATSGSGTGSFSASLSGLTPNTLYYVRAYATNAEGTSYGSESSFTTANTVKYWAQSFTATNTGTLTKVALYLKLASGASGSAKVRIYSNGSGSPDAVLQTISTKSITNSSYEYVEFNCNVAVTTTNVYWIILEDPISVGSYHIHWGSNSAGGYADGAIKYTLSSAPTTWINTSHTSDDATFKAFIQPTLSTSYDISVDYKRKYL